ncbi:expressed unknown protein [Seminavis robusta]|uniref:Uncharacterized protein n=1 Tax=Seminavis robusta TaxID=568900 RepID=A0A9N8DQ31_9STRA|nr:expressed unknown protein [Seminavis robusta]|eukprot:Sro271_g104620.1 n/a (229) ;mRNA; f:56354-57040
MKETATKQFEFPDRKPEDWELIASMVAPFPKAQITKDNVSTALSWFDELCSARGLEICDKVFCEDVIWVLLTDTKSEPLLSSESELEAMRSERAQVLEKLQTSFTFSLTRSKGACFAILHRCLEDAPYLFGMEEVNILVAFLAKHDECKEQLWECLKEYVPSTVSNWQFEELLGQDLFPALLHGEMALHDQEARFKRQVAKVADGLSSYARSQLGQDDYICRNLFSQN